MANNFVPETPEDIEFCKLADTWRARNFKSGVISRAQVEAVTINHIYEWFLPLFQSEAQKGAARFRKSPLEPTWWEGLAAFSKVFGRRLAAGVAAYDRGASEVTFEVWARMMYAHARAAVGTLPDGMGIPVDWAEDPKFATAWAAAVSSTNGDWRFLTMFTLALYWDTFYIPLRYFSDKAALELVRALTPLLPLKSVELDSYRKDIRGKQRKGLGLDGPAIRDIVVQLDKDQSTLFFINRSRLERLGMRPIELEIKTKIPLVFEFRE